MEWIRYAAMHKPTYYAVHERYASTVVIIWLINCVLAPHHRDYTTETPHHRDFEIIRALFFIKGDADEGFVFRGLFA